MMPDNSWLGPINLAMENIRQMNNSIRNILRHHSKLLPIGKRPILLRCLFAANGVKYTYQLQL